MQITRLVVHAIWQQLNFLSLQIAIIYAISNIFIDIFFKIARRRIICINYAILRLLKQFTLCITIIFKGFMIIQMLMRYIRHHRYLNRHT